MEARVDYLLRMFVLAQENLGGAAPAPAGVPTGAPAGGAATSPIPGCGADPNGMFTMVIWLVLLFGLMYFMLIRPQKKQRDAHAKLMESLKKGDRVVTSSGILGTIVSIGDGAVIVESCEGTKIRIQKAHVTGLQAEPGAKTGNEGEKK